MRFVTLAALAAFALASAPDGAIAQDLVRGEQIYGLCTQCHGERGQGNALALAPAIAGLGDWYVKAQLHNFKNGVRGMHPDDVGGLRMYPMSLSLKDEADLDAVAAYVASLPATDPVPTVEGGDAARGAASFATCAACHGPEARGNQALNAPRLVETNDWYLVESLKKFKAGIRGGNPGNQQAVLMRGMALSLADDQAIKDVVAYIVSLDGQGQ